MGVRSNMPFSWHLTNGTKVWVSTKIAVVNTTKATIASFLDRMVHSKYPFCILSSVIILEEVILLISFLKIIKLRVNKPRNLAKCLLFQSLALDVLSYHHPPTPLDVHPRPVTELTSFTLVECRENLGRDLIPLPEGLILGISRYTPDKETEVLDKKICELFSNHYFLNFAYPDRI